MSEQSKAAQGSAAAAPEVKFSQMTAAQKVVHLLKVSAFLASFGFAFPNVFEQF